MQLGNRRSRPVFTGSAVALHCCKAHSKSIGKMENSTPCKIATPENFILKLGTRDYVENITHYTNFHIHRISGGFSTNRWHITPLWLFSCPVLTVPTVKILKFQKSKKGKNAISRPRFERFRRNLAWGRSSTVLTVPTVKILKFQKSKMAAAAILKNRKLTYLVRGLSDFDKIWHTDVRLFLT